MPDLEISSLERRLGHWARSRLGHHGGAFVMFVLKQGWAALFGILFLLALIATRAVWQPEWWLARYDALFLFAIAIQALFLWLGLEDWAEARVIALFHLTGTVMEVFKLAQGSWDYPEAGFFEIGGVPLFSGFMYGCVGSFMARVIRGFHMIFAPYPPFWTTLLLAGAIYANFFTHHFLPDIRWALFAATVLLFWRTRIWFYPGAHPYWMPLPVAAFLSAIFLWIAENVGTFTRTWVYAGQGSLDLVSLGKLGSWYLLLYVSFVTVTLVLRDHLSPQPVRPGPREI
ncbi:DUF817 domain-containing protein [Cereibacter sphaeroides]|nr:DUF817 domain-containing protein [Cereibacter sphaeroides]